MSSAAELNALFGKPRPGMQQLDLGQIELPSGRVIAADPLVPSSAWLAPFAVRPGSYHVQALAGSVASWGKRNAVLRLLFNQRAAVRFEAAGAIPVDAGLAGFYALELSAALSAAVDDDSIFETPFMRDHNADCGLIELPAGVVALCRSGFGDGIYTTYVGYDANNVPALIMIDFGVEPELL